MTSIQILALYGGLLGILFLGLSFKVTMLRRKHRVGVGDGDVSELRRAVRVQANFAEYVPVLLIQMAILVALGAPAWALHLIGGLIFLSRVVFSYGLGQYAGTSKARFSGMLTTYILLLVQSVYLLGLAVL